MVHLSPTKFAPINDREKGDTFLTHFWGVQQRRQKGDTSPPFWGKSNNDEWWVTPNFFQKNSKKKKKTHIFAILIQKPNIFVRERSELENFCDFDKKKVNFPLSEIDFQRDFALKISKIFSGSLRSPSG